MKHAAAAAGFTFPLEAGPHRAPPTADTNLGVVMLALLVMGLINYSMRDPCTC